MVEDKKKKYLLNVASSEKVDSLNRYNSFFIASLPFPGCEFFKVYKDNKYNGEKLYFPWDEGHCKLQFYGEALDRIDLYSNSFRLHDYKNWDLCYPSPPPSPSFYYLLTPQLLSFKLLLFRLSFYYIIIILIIIIINNVVN